MIDLYFSIPAIIVKTFNPTAELEMPTGITTNEAYGEIETQQLLAEIESPRKTLKKLFYYYHCKMFKCVLYAFSMFICVFIDYSNLPIIYVEYSTISGYV